MSNLLEQLTNKETFPAPIRITQPEPWQWEVLAKAFLNDDVLNFWIGEECNEAVLRDFFEALIKDTLQSGGAVFTSPDHKVVLIWTRLGYGLEAPNEWKQQWHRLLNPEGVKRYSWLYDAGNMSLDPARQIKSMLPDYMGVLPEAQGRGYGSHLLKWTLDYFDELGYETPFLLASSRRSAKLYAPLLDFSVHQVVVLDEAAPDKVAVFMTRNQLDL